MVMHAVRAILILLLALHPAMVLGARTPAAASPSPLACSCCDGEVCACGCSDTGTCICFTPDPLNNPLPVPPPAPSPTQFKPITGLPAGSWPRVCGNESEPRSLGVDQAHLLVRAALTSCDSAQALLCIWTT